MTGSQQSGLQGKDLSGKVFSTPDELWSATKGSDGSHSEWYNKAVQYWDQQEASYDGVLGGFGHLSDVDIRDSKALLLKALGSQLEAAARGEGQLVAIDCGAGVGRVTEQLLLHYFQEVDLLEPSAHLISNAVKRFSQPGAWPPGHCVRHTYTQGLQDWRPIEGRYDCIWLQWCLLYLTDDDLLALLARCVTALKPGGIIFVKENVCKAGFVVDSDDNSLSRSSSYLLDLFARAGMRLLYNVKQRSFPRELYEVRMYVVQPATV